MTTFATRACALSGFRIHSHHVTAMYFIHCIILTFCDRQHWWIISKIMLLEAYKLLFSHLNFNSHATSSKGSSISKRRREVKISAVFATSGNQFKPRAKLQWSVLISSVTRLQVQSGWPFCPRNTKQPAVSTCQKLTSRSHISLFHVGKVPTVHPDLKTHSDPHQAQNFQVH